MGMKTTSSWSIFILTGGVRCYRWAQGTAGETLVASWLEASVSRLHRGKGESYLVRELI